MRAKEALLGMSGVATGMKAVQHMGPVGQTVGALGKGISRIKSFFGGKKQEAPNMGSRGVPPSFGGQQMPQTGGRVQGLSFANMAKAAGLVSGMEKAAAEQYDMHVVRREIHRKKQQDAKWKKTPLYKSERRRLIRKEIDRLGPPSGLGIAAGGYGAKRKKD